MIKVLFVCLGNICRSPMAQIVFQNMVQELGLESEFEIDSAGTEGYNEACHAGIHRGTKEILRRKGIPFEEHYSRKIRQKDYDYSDALRYVDCGASGKSEHSGRIFHEKRRSDYFSYNGLCGGY